MENQQMPLVPLADLVRCIDKLIVGHYFGCYLSITPISTPHWSLFYK